MIWNICFPLSVAITVIGIMIAMRLFGSKQRQNNDTLGFFTLAVTVFITACVMFFAYAYANDYDGEVGGAVNSVLLAIRKSIGIFVVDGDFAFFRENMEGMLPALVPLASTFMALIVIAAPIFTFGFVLSFFKNLSSRIRFSLKRNADVYVFSELNEKSLVLATDLKNNNIRRVIAFCDVFENDDKRFGELLASAKKIDAIFFDKDVLDIDFHKHTKRGTISFFITGTDENENIKQSLGLVERYGQCEQAHLYMFSSSISSEALYFGNKDNKIKIHRINESSTMVRNVLYSDPTVVFQNTSAITPEGDKVISVVILGLGGHGTEWLKTLVWYGQMDGYKLKIDAFDQDESAEDRIAYQCPEVLSEEYNHKNVPGEARYSVTVHSNIKVGTKTFANEIAKLTEASFVFVCLGDDDLNIDTAVEMRVMFERMHISPAIYAVVYNDKLSACLDKLTTHRGQSYQINAIGGIGSSYCEKVIALEHEALALHAAYGDTEQNFYAREYNINAAMSTVLHNRARVELQVNGAHLPVEQRTEEQLRKLNVLEHRRWVAYMRSIGYVYSGSTDFYTRNDLGKMHHSLVGYLQLDTEDLDKNKSIESIECDD